MNDSSSFTAEPFAIDGHFMPRVRATQCHADPLAPTTDKAGYGISSGQQNGAPTVPQPYVLYDTRCMCLF